MIKYQLTCAHDHRFEAWFANSAAFDDQSARHLVACPCCGSNEVGKAPMAPAVATRAPIEDRQRAHHRVRALIAELHAEIRRSAEYVGADFAEEARKIHYAEVPPRGIYGEADLDDAEALREEGIEVFALPRLPDDEN